MALQIKKAGIRHVRPLAGGLDAWRQLGYPVEPVIFPTTLAATKLHLDISPEV